MVDGAVRWLSTVAMAVAVVIGGYLQITSSDPQGVDSSCRVAQSAVLHSSDGERETELLENTTRWLHDIMEPARIKENLRQCTSQADVGGTPADYRQALYTRDTWRSYHMDEAVLNRYDVFLSHPNTSEPSRVYLLDEDGKVKFTSSLSENQQGVDQGEMPAYLAFCPSGDIRSKELVYVNYGRKEDFDLLEQMGISVKNRMVIMRFGAVFRGNKIKNAQEHGAVGAILYTDPADYGNPENTTNSYPNSIWLPDTGIQRGVVTWLDGDTLTYGYPATAGSLMWEMTSSVCLPGVVTAGSWILEIMGSDDHRRPGGEVEDAFRDPTRPTANMPLHPCHTLSARDAHKLLKNMGGDEAPAAWQGTLSGTYRLGPQLARADWSVRLHVNNMERVLPTYNVLGFLRGSVEPDRYVILGNHRDSWSYGSLDPCSASATMMEVVRAFGVLRHNGWRPRRTLVFASWGSGEFGYYGANELIEEYVHLIGGRTVAYLNVDLAIIYTFNLMVVATPLMQRVTVEAAKRVAAPDQSLGFTTLYDHWRAREKGNLFSYNLGSPSEHWSFYQQLGTPVVYMMWEIDFERWDWNDFPLYHTMYETMDAMAHLDPDYVYHTALGRLWAVIGQRLADHRLLPMDVTDEVHPLRLGLAHVADKFAHLMRRHNVSLGGLERAVDRYENVAGQFRRGTHAGQTYTDLECRRINDQMVGVERSFIDPNGLLVDYQNRNAVFGTDPEHEYNGVFFPDVVETLVEVSRQPDNPRLWQRVQRALAAAIFVVNSATSSLRNPGFFVRPSPEN